MYIIDTIFIKKYFLKKFKNYYTKMNGENKLSEINSLCDSTELSDIELGNDGTENKIDGSVELFGLVSMDKVLEI